MAGVRIGAEDENKNGVVRNTHVREIRMHVIEKPLIGGQVWLLIKCDRCEMSFLVAPNEMANGNVRCEFCPNICRKEDIKDISKEKLDHFVENIREAWSPDSETNTSEEQK